MKQRISAYSTLSIFAFSTWLGCGSEPAPGGATGPAAPSGAASAAAASGTAGAAVLPGATGTAGAAGRASLPATPGTVGSSGGAGTGGALASGTAGAASAAGAGVSTAGDGAAAASGGGGAASSDGVKLPPSKRNPAYASEAPAVGEPLPRDAMGMWKWIAVEGAASRDGSPAGFFYKYSATGNKNVLLYLVGGGVCADNFFCNMNPPNKDASLTAENVGAGVFNIFGPDQEAQDPTGERWQSGIFKNDPANPVKDWNMIFIPYVTGDVFFGSKANGTVPGVEGSFQFVGKTNMTKFLERIIPTFKDAEKVIISGSSAGGIGSLLNYPALADGFIDQGNGARVFVVDDAGPFFDDAYLEVCIQKRYRDMYGLNDSFPKDCKNCNSGANGGGLVSGYLEYLADKYPEGLVGGLVDSDQDEIMKFFFSEGLEDCGYIENPIVGLLAYPEDRYPAALTDLLTKHVDKSRISSYIWSGDLHQNFFQTATADRFYQKNGLDKTVAEWLTTLLTGQNEHIGLLK